MLTQFNDLDPQRRTGGVASLFSLVPTSSFPRLPLPHSIDANFRCIKIDPDTSVLFIAGWKISETPSRALGG